MSVRLKTNSEWLLKIPVEVKPVHPTWSRQYRVGHDGMAHAVAGVGGITYNLRVGDSAVTWVADHFEPCVSTRNPDEPRNNGAALLSCVGNRATVASGDAEGDKGFVTGKHGGCEHIMIDFPGSTLRKLSYGDTIRIETWGQGMQLTDLPEVKVMNLDPTMLSNPRWRLEADGGRLRVPVAFILPSKIMGSGLGSNACQRGDYDIQLFDEVTVKELGLSRLRLGDVVAISDADHSFGRIFRSGAVTVGVVCHGASVGAGHGPGVTTLFTSPTGAIEPVESKQANLAHILKRPSAGRRKATTKRRSA